jgi:hypothetical protein
MKTIKNYQRLSTDTLHMMYYSDNVSFLKFAFNFIDKKAIMLEALDWTSSNGKMKLFKFLFAFKECILQEDIDDAGRNAARFCNINLIRFLLKNGLDICRIESEAIEQAATLENKQMLRFLFKNGAQISDNLFYFLTINLRVSQDIANLLFKFYEKQ